MSRDDNFDSKLNELQTCKNYAYQQFLAFSGGTKHRVGQAYTYTRKLRKSSTKQIPKILILSYFLKYRTKRLQCNRPRQHPKLSYVVL